MGRTEGGVCAAERVPVGGPKSRAGEEEGTRLLLRAASRSPRSLNRERTRAGPPAPPAASPPLHTRSRARVGAPPQIRFRRRCPAVIWRFSDDCRRGGAARFAVDVPLPSRCGCSGLGLSSAAGCIKATRPASPFPALEFHFPSLLAELSDIGLC